MSPTGALCTRWRMPSTTRGSRSPSTKPWRPEERCPSGRPLGDLAGDLGGDLLQAEEGVGDTISCADELGFDSLSRLLLEKKEAFRQRLGFSPDGGDALALTFAEPISKLRRRRERVRARRPGGGGRKDRDAEVMSGPWD